MEISKDNIRCPQCGAALDLSLAEKGLVPCKYCGQKIPLAKESTPPSALYYLRIGDSNLYDCKFDSAYSAYEKAAKEAPDEHTAYFGMALASFRVQYINDEVNGRIQPICHEISRKVFTEDKNYRHALSLANDAQRAEYERQGQQIDYIREQFYALQSTGLDYDCFICVKVSDGTGGRTEDSRYADILYNELKLKGYVPFYSEKEIKGKTGGDYEAHILYALYTSECMLVVCSEEDWLRTPWVKNEYTRFLRMIGDSEKESDSLTILFSGAPIERLPGKNGKIQGIKIGSEHGTINELELFRIAEFVEKHTPESRRKREEAEAEKSRREKELDEYIEKQRLIDQKIKELSQAPAAGGGGASVTVSSLMSRARQEAMTGNFKGAESYYNKVLDIAPESSRAWLGLFYTYNMTTEDSGLTVYSQCENAEQFNTRYKANEELKGRFEEKFFRMALQYADEEESKALNVLKTETLRRISEGDSGMADNMIQIARQKISAGQFDVYAECDCVLKVFPDNAYAYWLKFLADIKVRNEQQIAGNLTPELLQKLIDGGNYFRALKLAGENSQYLQFHKWLTERLAETRSQLVNQWNELDKRINGNRKERKIASRKANESSKYTIDIEENWAIWGVIAAFICAVIWLGLLIWWKVAGMSDSMPAWLVWGTTWIEEAEESWGLFSFIFIIGYLIQAIVYGVVCGIIIAILYSIIASVINNKRENKRHAINKAKSLENSLQQEEGEIVKIKNHLKRDIDNCEKIINFNIVSSPIPKSEIQTEFNVVLKNAGVNKQDVIKVVRAFSDLDLIEAKEAVERGGVLKANIAKEEAEKIVAALKAVGANVVME